MDDASFVFHVELGAGQLAESRGEVVQRVAEECCCSDPAAASAVESFVMVSTEFGNDGLVKKVVFDQVEAADRFMPLLTLVEPGLAVRRWASA